MPQVWYEPVESILDAVSVVPPQQFAAVEGADAFFCEYLYSDDWQVGGGAVVVLPTDAAFFRVAHRCAGSVTTVEAWKPSCLRRTCWLWTSAAKASNHVDVRDGH